MTWISSYVTDPFDVSVAEKIALLGEWSEELLGAAASTTWTPRLRAVKECKFYSDGGDHRAAAAGPAEPVGHRDRAEPGRQVRDHAHAGPAGRPRL